LALSCQSFAAIAVVEKASVVIIARVVSFMLLLLCVATLWQMPIRCQDLTCCNISTLFRGSFYVNFMFVFFAR
jgi:hypothetical protein